MNWLSFLAPLLAKANTHATGNIGLGTALGGLAVHIAAGVVAQKPTHSTILNVALGVLDASVASPMIAGGSLAAYFGMPKTIATSDSASQS